MALSADAVNIYENGGEINSLPVKASTKIYKGSAVGDDGAGAMRRLTAGDKFRGFALSQADNSAGLVGVINVDLLGKGRIRATLTSVAVTDVGKPVYMSDDATFTLTQGTNSPIGRVYRYVTTNTCIIEFEALKPKSPSKILYAGTADGAGGSATQTLTVTGVASTDVVQACVRASTNAVSVQKVTPTANTITVILSGDPGANTKIDYTVLRAVAE